MKRREGEKNRKAHLKLWFSLLSEAFNAVQVALNDEMSVQRKNDRVQRRYWRSTLISQRSTLHVAFNADTPAFNAGINYFNIDFDYFVRESELAFNAGLQR